jgi:hypothetical protein
MSDPSWKLFTPFESKLAAAKAVHLAPDGL